MPTGSSALRPNLPRNLLDQLDVDGSSGTKIKKPRHQISRKDARKQDRLERKKRKADFFSAAPNLNSVKRSADGEHAESPKRKKAKVADPAPVASNKPRVESIGAKLQVPSSQLSAELKKKPKTKTKTALQKLVTPSETRQFSVSSRSQKEREDDAYIAYLESKLGYGKDGKGKKQAEEEDGLDDLLDFTSSIVPSLQQDLASEVSETSEESDDGISDEASNSDEESTPSEVKDTADDGVVTTLPPAHAKSAANSDPIPGSHYVPPHLRNQSDVNEKDSELMIKLTRQLKGLLNRMSEQNMSNILDSIEEAYQKHRRHDVTSTLTTLIIGGISSHSILLDSYVVLYAAFVSSLHKVIGIDFAAYFVQNVVSSYETHRTTLPESSDLSDVAPRHEGDVDPKGKECSNLIVLLSELYNFQVISSVLVFDVIRDLLDQKLTEFNVELLLKIVRNSGQQLRQDDPSALKDIIGIVQTKLSGQDERLSSRTRFMIETLTNLKNNKLKRTAGQQHQGGEAVERMKKFLSGLAKKRHVLAHEPLRVSLEDLHSAESKGKWWLIGAAWGGDPLLDRQTTSKADENADASDINNNTLLKLARKQGMNTDIRRSIFVVLMSSDDYVDACERLSQLNLTEVQQREIIRVILHCCGNEKTYNPYYTLVAQHLCRTSHSYKVTLQFCLWDFLRDLGETTVGGAEVIKNLKEDDGFEVKNISETRMGNIAKAYGWWLAKDCCTLAILKPVDFTLLKPRTSNFLKDLLTHLFISSQVSTPIVGAAIPTTRNRGAIEEMFIKATRIETLALGLVYFLSTVVTRSKDGEKEGLVKWASGVAVDTLRAGMDIIPNL